MPVLLSHHHHTSTRIFFDAADCPGSRPTLQLLRRRGSTQTSSLSPSWIFAHEIKNFEELHNLQQQASRSAEAFESKSIRSSTRSLCPLVVDVVDGEDNKSHGVGLFHSRPLIAARLVEGLPSSRRIDAAFLREKLLDAASRRRGLPNEAFLPRLEPDTLREADCKAQATALSAFQRRSAPPGFYRLIHGEADGLPGLVVDCFGSAVAVQQLTRGKLL